MRKLFKIYFSGKFRVIFRKNLKKLEVKYNVIFRKF